MEESRSNVVSSFTVIKGSLIDETYAVFRNWDFELSATENRRRAWQENIVAAASARAAEDRVKAIGRRFDPAGRDRPIVNLAIAGCDRDVWKPLLLFHMTRDEFLVRDFLLSWLYPRFVEGAFRLRTDDVLEYLASLGAKEGIAWSGKWAPSTTSRVASGLLQLASDFGILTGGLYKEFTSFQMSDESFVYLLHAIADIESNARRIVDAEDWHMFLMDASDVERELLRLHQFRKVHYEVAGSLAQLRLPNESAADYAKELCV